MRSKWHSAMTALSVGLLAVAHTQVALACGGCFLPQATTETSIVTGHRMAFALSTTRTVLWDQIAYSGDPADFSWVLPVRGDASLEAAEDAWFESLDAVSSARVSPPQLNCLNRVGSRNSGCACGSSDEAVGGSFGAPGSNLGGGSITVTHEGTVGPYEFVQLRATSSASLAAWLPANGYALPASVVPVIDAYVRDQFDFVALKLKPGIGTRQMAPVRVVTKGATPTLPLRMVAAGTGAFVGITLYVISESRLDAADFGHASIDPAQLTFDWSSRKSNYSQLRADALAAAGGLTWLTTFAARGALSRSWADALGASITFSTSAAAGRPTGPVLVSNLADLYFAQAAANAGIVNHCSVDAGRLTSLDRVVDTCVAVPPADGPLDASSAPDSQRDEATAPSEAGSDGAARAMDAARSDGDVIADGPTEVAARDVQSPPPATTAPSSVIPKPQRTCGPVRAGEIPASNLECGGFTDLAAATIGMHLADVWITRLEANLPHDALTRDLSLQPAASQVEIVNAMRATKHINPPCELVEDHPFEAALGSRTPGRAPVAHASFGFLSALGLLVARRLARKRQ